MDVSAFNTAGASMVGQNIGAEKYKRVLRILVSMVVLIVPIYIVIGVILFLFPVLFGTVKILLTECKIEKGQNFVTGCSMATGILTVFFLAMTREAYAITAAFLLLIIKGILFIKITKAKSNHNA